MTITQTGGEAVVSRLTGIRERMRDLTPITSIAAADTATLIDDSFANSRAPDGSAWAPLAESTLMGRARSAAGPTRVSRALIGPLPEGVSRTRTRRWTRRRSEAAAAAVFNATPLNDSGRLRASLFSRGSRDGLIFGTNTPYARPHHNGAQNGRPPRRAFLPVDLIGNTWAFVQTGPAGEHWRRVSAAFARFIATGEVTL